MGSPSSVRPEAGRRPAFGGADELQRDPHRRDHILIHEDFHADRGAGSSASHKDRLDGARGAALRGGRGCTHRGKTRPGAGGSGAWLLLALALGCHLNVPAPRGLAAQKNLTVVGSELRIRVRALAAPYAAAIEEAADDAARRCGSDPAVRIGALGWKLEAIPQAQDALFQTDPLVGLLDGWAYAMQMQTYLESPAGRAAFGACHSDAARAMGKVAARGRQIVDALAPDRGQRAEDLVREWAAARPLRSLSLPRASIAPALAKANARESLGALAAVGAVVETLDDLTARIATYRETLSKEARWTGELAAIQAASSDVALRAADDADRIAAAMERIGRLAEETPRLAARERAATLEDIDAMRSETLARFQAEGDKALRQIDRTSNAAIDRAADRAEQIVDHAFLRAAQLTLGLLIATALAVVLVGRALGFRFRTLRRA